MVKLLKKFWNIIKGTYFNITKKHQDKADKRLKVCNKCDKVETLHGIGKICTMCGCILESKTRVEDEKCEMNKW
jgi:hypothetical protein